MPLSINLQNSGSLGTHIISQLVNEAVVLIDALNIIHSGSLGTHVISQLLNEAVVLNSRGQHPSLLPQLAS